LFSFQLTQRGYLNEQQSVTIEIEIFFSHLMYSPEYTPLDDIVRKQKQQIMYIEFYKKFLFIKINIYLNFRRELQAAQNENFQLEKKLHELQISIQNPNMSNRLSDVANGPQSGLSASATPEVVRKYHEMKYGNKGPSNTSPLSMYNNATSFDAGQSTLNSLPTRNGVLPGKGPLSSVPQPNVTMGSRNSTFKFPTKLPDSIQSTITNTSQSLQSKLPASLQKLPASFTQGPTMNMLANKFQNAFS
jgi:hypothetical protein